MSPLSLKNMSTSEKTKHEIINQLNFIYSESDKFRMLFEDKERFIEHLTHINNLFSKLELFLVQHKKGLLKNND